MSIENPDALDAYPIGDDECLDADGEVWPEHDFPPEGQGDECRRCNAQADLSEDEEAELDRRLRDAARQLMAAVGTEPLPADFTAKLLAKANENTDTTED